MQLFYTPEIDPNGFIMNKGESHHALRVLRLNVGSEIHLLDGKGSRFKGIIIDIQGKSCFVGEIEVEEHVLKNPHSLHMAFAPPKSMDRLQMIIEKSTEIGVAEFSLVHCAHSERKNVKLDKLNHLVVAAIKQSKNLFLPKINDFIDFNNFIEQNNNGGYIAHCNSHFPKKDLKSALTNDLASIILIGPEGDFSPNEITLAEENGYVGVNLSNTRLRTETAAIVASVIYNQH